MKFNLYKTWKWVSKLQTTNTMLCTILQYLTFSQPLVLLLVHAIYYIC